MELIRPSEAISLICIWALYASVDWIADSVVRAVDSVVSVVCPMLMICV